MLNGATPARQEARPVAIAARAWPARGPKPPAVHAINSARMTSAVRELHGGKTLGFLTQPGSINPSNEGIVRGIVDF